MILYMYIAQDRDTQPPGDKVLMLTEMSRHFIHLLQVKKKVFEVWFYTVFHDLIHVYSTRTEGTQPPGDKILMSTERPYHFTHLLQVSKTSLWSLILYIFFHDVIHYIALRQGAYNP